ncbi:hypothetical protein Q9L58_008311 [Maublancomyces gigas]|uniref:Uncharacterized protein n=1 Tax=Discina gigas TaxID=1032678 RepID=A0ABR3GA51_9PEZI
MSATGFYQPIIPQDSNDYTERPLTFKQLFEDLGIAFQWIEFNADKDWSHPQNAYAAGLVLIMSPEDHTRAVVSSRTTAANLVVNLVDFSNAPVPVANYILLRHNVGVCRAVDSAELQGAADCPALRALLPSGTAIGQPPS